MEHDYKKFPELTNAQLQTEAFSSPHQQIIEDFTATVVRVHDGDTVTLKTTFRDFEFPLRFINIDAPEMNNGGEVARDWLRAQIDGNEVEIKIDVKQRVGKYGRLLGRVISRGMDMGNAEVLLGLAVPFGQKRQSEIQPLHKIFRLDQWF